MVASKIVRVSCVSIAVLVAVAAPAHAGSVNLVWNPSSGATGYKVYSGSSSEQYGAPVVIGNTTEMTFGSMPNCVPTFFAVKASNSAGDSGFSNEISTWPKPELSTVSPLQAERGASLDVVIMGNNFDLGASVQFSSPDISVNSVSRNDCGEVTATITVGSSAAFGPVDVSVVNTNGVTGISAVPFNVISAPLAVVPNLHRTDKQ